MNVLIPMAGMGNRFAKTGRYPQPKPLIPVFGEPMIIRVLENLSIKGNYIFIILKIHEKFLSPVLKSYIPDCKIISIDQVTEGAACTCLLAKEFINTSEDILVANCDQIMDWDREEFYQKISSEDIDGLILTFLSNSLNNSYAKVNRHGYVTRVAEKEVISDKASTGVYWWRQGKVMVDACEKMIKKNIRYRNEFYLCPCYNEMIEDGFIVKTLAIKNHYPIGTPEDLEKYIEGK